MPQAEPALSTRIRSAWLHHLTRTTQTVLSRPCLSLPLTLPPTRAAVTPQVTPLGLIELPLSRWHLIALSHSKSRFGQDETQLSIDGTPLPPTPFHMPIVRPPYAPRCHIGGARCGSDSPGSRKWCGLTRRDPTRRDPTRRDPTRRDPIRRDPIRRDFTAVPSESRFGGSLFHKRRPAAARFGHAGIARARAPPQLP